MNGGERLLVCAMASGELSISSMVEAFDIFSYAARHRNARVNSGDYYERKGRSSYGA
jgi:hypothetical protein